MKNVNKSCDQYETDPATLVAPTLVAPTLVACNPGRLLPW
jgi:hypothetical protein